MSTGAAIVVGCVNDRVTVSFGETAVAWLALDRDEAELLAVALLTVARRIPVVPALKSPAPSPAPPDMPAGP